MVKSRARPAVATGKGGVREAEEDSGGRFGTGGRVMPHQKRPPSLIYQGSLGITSFVRALLSGEGVQGGVERLLSCGTHHISVTSKMRKLYMKRLSKSSYTKVLFALFAALLFQCSTTTAPVQGGGAKGKNKMGADRERLPGGVEATHENSTQVRYSAQALTCSPEEVEALAREANKLSSEAKAQVGISLAHAQLAVCLKHHKDKFYEIISSSRRGFVESMSCNRLVESSAVKALMSLEGVSPDTMEDLFDKGRYLEKESRLGHGVISTIDRYRLRVRETVFRCVDEDGDIAFGCNFCQTGGVGDRILIVSISTKEVPGFVEMFLKEVKAQLDSGWESSSGVGLIQIHWDEVVVVDSQENDRVIARISLAATSDSVLWERRKGRILRRYPQIYKRSYPQHL